jgi:pimeloyl-ACP methyl ester carboxylesterase
MRITPAASALLLAAIVAGCAGAATSVAPVASAPEASPSANAVASATPNPSPPPHFAELFEIGDGHTLFMECTGEGSPTVVFEAGDESDGRQWGRVVVGLVRDTRVCTYDRLGTGRSTQATGCRGLEDIRGDLEALLAAAKVEPPYVLVGTSGGGYLAAGYALAHPDDVSGIVLVDTFPAIDLSRHPPELAFQIGCENPSNIEHRDYAAVEHAAWDERTKIGDVPVRVITNDYGASATNLDEEESVEGQQGWFALNPDDAKQILVTSGHNVPENEPGVVIDAIREVLASAS